MPASVQAFVFSAFFFEKALNEVGTPILPTLLAGLGLPELYTGVLFAAKPVFGIGGNTLAGPIVDRHRPEHVLLWAIAGLTLSTSAFGFTLFLQHRPVLIAFLLMFFRCTSGLVSAFVMSSGMALVARTHGPQDRPMAISNVLIGVGAGVVTAGAVGGFLASLFGPSSPYHIFALCLLLDAALFVCFVDVERYEHGIGKTIDEPGSKKADISFSEFWSQLRNMDIWCINLLLVAANVLCGALQPSVPLYLAQTYHTDTFQQGLVWGLLAALYMGGRPVSVLLSRAFGEGAVMAAGVVTMSLSMGLIGCGSRLWVLLPAVAGVGVGISFVTTPAMMMLAPIAERLPGLGYGTAYSMADISMCLGMTLGPPWGSALHEGLGFWWMCQISGALGLCCVPCALHFVENPVDGGARAADAASAGGALADVEEPCEKDPLLPLHGTSSGGSCVHA